MADSGLKQRSLIKCDGSFTTETNLKSLCTRFETKYKFVSQDKRNNRAHKTMANKKSGLLSKVPLPDTFFSIKHQLRPIAPLRLSAPSAVVVYLLTLGGFIGCWIIYSAAGPTVTYTVTQQEWQKEGYECIPLQNEPNYDVLYTYDECLSNFQEPSTSTVSKVSSTWIYQPISGSKKSLQTGAKGKDADTILGSKKCDGTNQIPVCASNGAAGVECQMALNQPDQTNCVNLFQDIMRDYKSASLCSAFKENSPFKCSKTEVSYKSDLEKLSLSIANTQLLFGILTSLCAYIFYKVKKDDEISPAKEAGWQEAVLNLEKRIEKRLREELSIKADKSEQQTV